MGDLSIQELVTKLSLTAVDVSELVEGIPAESLTSRPGPDEFSVLENVCHLRDIEVEGYTVRIQRLLNEQHPKLHDLDGGKLASERHYNQQDVNEALRAFTQARLSNVAVLSETSEIQLGRTGELEGVGEISLFRLVEMMCEHDEGHVDELRVGRRRILKAKEASPVI